MEVCFSNYLFVGNVDFILIFFSDDSPSKKLKVNSKDTVSACAPPPGYKDHTENDDEKNNRTAFISNLAFKLVNFFIEKTIIFTFNMIIINIYRTDEDTLRKILSEYGEIVDLRIIKSAKSFGCICYCEYSNEVCLLFLW